jgi:hypothetical protein
MKVLWSNSVKFKVGWPEGIEPEERSMGRKEISMRNTKRALVLITAAFAVSTILIIGARGQSTHERGADLLLIESACSALAK